MLPLWFTLAAATDLVPVHGAVTATDGAPLSGAHVVTFTLVDAGGASLWSNVQTVHFAAGGFAAALPVDSTFRTALLADPGLTVQVDGGSPSPAVPLGWAARALFAQSAPWSGITGRPAGLDDGDDDTRYTAGSALTLTGTTFAVDHAGLTPVWTQISGRPTGLDDGDDDTRYAAGSGLQLTAATFSARTSDLDGRYVVRADGSSTCDASTKGGLRWTGTGFEGCDGSTWRTIASASAGSTGRSCWDILQANPASTSNVYTLDPDDSGPEGAIQTWCDMTNHGGGWQLIGKFGNANASKTMYDHDRSIASLTNANLPAGADDAHFNLARFVSYGNTWTIRAQVDSNGNGTHYQYAFWRPNNLGLTTTQAGQNWVGTDTNTRIQHLLMSSTSGLTNTTWIATPGYDLTHQMVFGYRQGAVSTTCLSGGQTAACHVPPGVLYCCDGNQGTYTAYANIGDGIAHAHSKRALYWMRRTNTGGTP